MATTLTRADSFTPLKRKQEFFSDFLNSFAKTPIGEQLGRVTNEQAVNQALRNLVKTNIGERLYQPGIGSNIYASLFELNTPPLINAMEFYIENTIKNNERRVNLVSVKVQSTLQIYNGIKTVRDDNSLTVTLVYNLINNPELITYNIILKRIR